MRYRKLRTRALHCTCRRCINEKYGLDLQPTDCVYHSFPGPCHVCGEARNIVVAVRFFHRWKVWFSNNKKGSQ